jgi:PAS domain S-box-containing protein
MQMKTVKEELSVLIVEDNPGDFALVEEFLLEQMPQSVIVQAKNYKEARETLCAADMNFDVILLDLSLPDKTGISLIKEIVELSEGMPVIVLTGYTDVAFGVNSLALGVSDYILKEELNPALLQKSILYSIERKKKTTELEESEKRYSELFHLSPQPMYVFDAKTLQFLDVNAAAVKYYGYSHDEFLLMGIKDIVPSTEVMRLDDLFSGYHNHRGQSYNGNFTHRKKNGKLRKVEVQSNLIDYKGKRAVVALAIDITERLNYVKAIELQNKKLREISFVQSHIVRAPLARIIGLVQLLRESIDHAQKEQILNFLEISADELDNVIREITTMTANKTDEVSKPGRHNFVRQNRPAIGMN